MTVATVRELEIQTPASMLADGIGPFLNEAREALDSLPEGAGRLVLDMSRTEHMDDSGLGALAELKNLASVSGRTVCVKRLRDPIARLLVQVGFHTSFEIG